MRTIWIVFCAISLAAAATIWMFAAGWAGRVAFLPNMELFATGEWPIWFAIFALMWGPIAAATWFGWRAIKEKNNNASD